MTRPDKLLSYNDELTDDEPMATIQISSHWIPYLVGACELLLDPDNWNPSDDVDLAISQARDAIVKLLGGATVSGLYSTHLPFTIPAVAMYWNPSCNPTYLYYYAGIFLTSEAYCDNAISSPTLAWFELALEPGDYILTCHYAKTASGGIYTIYSATLGEVQSQIDCYSATTVLIATESCELNIETAGVYPFSIEKIGREGTPSKNSIYISAVSVRRKGSGE